MPDHNGGCHMGETITSTQWINSVNIRNKHANVILVREKEVTIDKDTSKVLDTKTRMRYINDPKRTIYVTKPKYRTHRYKKESEVLEKLDAYTVRDSEVIPKLKEIFDIPQKKYMSLRAICNSPYIYNADIPIEVLIRDKYNKNQKHSVVPITIGALDIETCVDGTEVINAITFIAETHVYTAVHEDFMWRTDETGKRVRAKVSDIYRYANAAIKPYLDKYHFELDVQVCKSEMGIINWIFSKIHEEDMDFILIWNMGFDIPRIISRIAYNSKDPADVFSHPSVPEDLRICKFVEDTRDVAHFIERWHWVFTTCNSQFIDAEALYGRNRKSKPKEAYYTLEYISNKEVGAGKLKFNEDSHAEMQAKRFVEYAVYNMVDSMLIMMMEWKNHDTKQMLWLTGSSRYCDYSKQTNMLRDIYYRFLLERGRAFATTGESVTTEYSHYFIRRGGTVLNATMVRDMGINAILERPDYESGVVVFASDLDFKAYYPSTGSMYGLSKETKLATVVAIDGNEDKDYIEAIMGGVANPEANAVWIGHEYFGLPNYEEWSELAMKEFFKS